MNCDEASTRIAAWTDDELDAMASAEVERHVAGCARCGEEGDALRALRKRIRDEVPYHAAPPALRQRVRAIAPRATRHFERWRWVAAGAAMGCAATLLAFVVVTAALERNERDKVAQQAVASHVRASLADRRIAVASSDRHTVRPWLSSRLDFAPPVSEVAPTGYTLEGARVDMLDGQSVAALVYRYRDHVIDVFIRPERGLDPEPAMSVVRGFNVAHARVADMGLWVVSDLNAPALGAFAAELARAHGEPVLRN